MRACGRGIPIADQRQGEQRRYGQPRSGPDQPMSNAFRFGLARIRATGSLDHWTRRPGVQASRRPARPPSHPSRCWPSLLYVAICVRVHVCQVSVSLWLDSADRPRPARCGMDAGCPRQLALPIASCHALLGTIPGNTVQHLAAMARRGSEWCGGGCGLLVIGNSASARSVTLASLPLPLPSRSPLSRNAWSPKQVTISSPKAGHSRTLTNKYAGCAGICK
jgi:hypothetical protein